MRKDCIWRGVCNCGHGRHDHTTDATRPEFLVECGVPGCTCDEYDEPERTEE